MRIGRFLIPASSFLRNSVRVRDSMNRKLYSKKTPQPANLLPLSEHPRSPREAARTSASYPVTVAPLIHIFVDK